MAGVGLMEWYQIHQTHSWIPFHPSIQPLLWVVLTSAASTAPDVVFLNENMLHDSAYTVFVCVSYRFVCICVCVSVCVWVYCMYVFVCKCECVVHTVLAAVLPRGSSCEGWAAGCRGRGRVFSRPLFQPHSSTWAWNRNSNLWVLQLYSLTPYSLLSFSSCLTPVLFCLSSYPHGHLVVRSRLPSSILRIDSEAGTVTDVVSPVVTLLSS